MEEYFDVLDENGSLTGSIKARTLVHRDGDWHRAVHIWIFNKQCEVLLQRRSPNKDSDPGMLDISCAGHLSAGDDSITGALRELKEELGLDVKASDLRFITTLKRSPKHDDGFVDNEFDDLYLMCIDAKLEDLKMQEEEISELIFVPYKEFKASCIEGREDLVDYPDEYEILFGIMDRKCEEPTCS